MIINIPKYFKRSDFVFPGIYFMIKDGRVVYIGKSINFLNRLFAAGHSVDFDLVRVIPCPIDKLDHYEYRWIRRFRPENNYRHLKKALGYKKNIIVEF